MNVMTNDSMTKVQALHAAYEKAGIKVSKNGRRAHSAGIIITSDEGTDFAIRRSSDGSIVSVAYNPVRALSRRSAKLYASRKRRPYVIRKKQKQIGR